MAGRTSARDCEADSGSDPGASHAPAAASPAGTAYGEVGADSPRSSASRGRGGRPDSLVDPVHMPAALLWLITVVIGCMMALVSPMIRLSLSWLAFHKYQKYESILGVAPGVTETGGWVPGVAGRAEVLEGAVVLATVSAALAGLAAALVLLLYPIGQGSGLPEMKGYLNGSTIPGLFDWGIDWVRGVATVLAVAGGLAFGIEGPIIALGGSCGVWVVTVLAGPHFRKYAQSHACGPRMDSERQFAMAKRRGCIMGSAAGLAVAFRSPIGGVMYMFEEASGLSGPATLTLRTFVATMLAVLGAKTMMNIMSPEEERERLVVSDWMVWEQEVWTIRDIGFIFLLSVLGGLVSVVYTKGLIFVWKLRAHSPWCAWRRRRKVARVGEAMLMAMLTATVFAIAPALMHHCSGTVHETQRYVQYGCGPGDHNGLATLLLQTSEGAIRHLYDREDYNHPERHFFTLAELAVGLLLYLSAAIGTAGLSVPGGNFMPAMFMGAMMGRLFRRSLDEFGGLGIALGLTQPGIYALCGSASVLAGFTHMTVAIVAMLTEAAQDPTIVIPLMVSTCTGLCVKKVFSRVDFCEQLITLKGVPFLEAAPKGQMASEDMHIGNLCERIPREAVLARQVSVDVVVKALQLCPDLFHFPVVEQRRHRGRRICGLVPRGRLEAAAAAQQEDDQEMEMCNTGTGAGYVRSLTRRITQGPPQLRRQRTGLPPRSAEEEKAEALGDHVAQVDELWAEHAELGLVGEEGATSPSSQGPVLNVARLADPLPICVQADMPVKRLYPLFVHHTVDAVVVLLHLDEEDPEGRGGSSFPVGVLERRHLYAEACKERANHPERGLRTICPF